MHTVLFSRTFCFGHKITYENSVKTPVQSMQLRSMIYLQHSLNTELNCFVVEYFHTSSTLVSGSGYSQYHVYGGGGASSCETL